MNAKFLHNILNNFPKSWVITLTAQKFELETLSALCGQLASIISNLQIIHQQTLTDETQWEKNNHLPQAEQTSPVTSFQWIVNGELDEDFAKAIKQHLGKQNFGENLPKVDINAMPLEKMLKPHKLALFDMDSTLIEQEVIVELAKKAGIGEQVNEITESAMRGEIDFVESFTRRVGLLKGLSKDVLDEIIRDNITFSLGAKRLISGLKTNGYHVVLVSGGFNYFAEYVKNTLGIDEIYANDLDFEDDKLTGKVTSPIVDGKRKAEILQEVAKRLNIELSQTVAVGDGANDLPMLGLADIGIAYRAKPVVREQADFAINVTGLDGVLGILGLK